MQLLGISEKELNILMEVQNKTLLIRRIDCFELEKYKDFLIKKLIKRGSGFGLNIPIPILELLDINPETDSVEIEVEGSRLIIKKA